MRRPMVVVAVSALALVGFAAPGASSPEPSSSPAITRAALPAGWPAVLGPDGFFAATCAGATAPCRTREATVVTRIQKRLLALKYTSFGVKATGTFDAATGRAVQNFKARSAQRGNDIGATPRVGVRTFAALFAANAPVGPGGTSSGGGTGGGSGGGSTGGGGTVKRCGSFSGRTCKTVATGARFCPVIGAYLGDGWGVSRGDHSHQGIDLMIHEGAEVRAVESGYIVKAGAQNNGALAVTLQGRSGNVWYFGHNSENLVQAGDFVRGGTVIALSGDTGSPGAFHVHFEYRPGSPGSKWYYADPVNPIGVVKKICF